jgi:ring-1,2-phenylacetyl-CoA epoxidase subunit PaaE
MTADAPTRFHPLTVAAATRETADALAVTLRPPPGAETLFRFTPGQYLTLRRVIEGEELRRSYSICAGLDDGVLRIGIKRVVGGRFSGWAVENLRPGAVIEAMAPEGRFGLMPDAAAPPRQVLAIAAGSGITPILSVIASLLAREPLSRVVLLYGNRRAADIMFRDALERLKDRHMARLSVVHVLSGEKHELAALHGRLDPVRIAALLPGLMPPGAIDLAFLCGPPGLADGASEALAALGVAPERIQVERFVTGTAPPRAGLPPLRAEAAIALAAITLDGVTTEVPVAEDETVLEAAIRAGLDAPWSCRGGMCCTCRAKVSEGAVAMATNYSLQPWEIEAGFVLTCQSRPRAARLAVDYDQG